MMAALAASQSSSTQASRIVFTSSDYTSRVNDRGGRASAMSFRYSSLTFCEFGSIVEVNGGGGMGGGGGSGGGKV